MGLAISKLLGSSLFTGLDHADVERIIALGSPSVVDSGQVICSQGVDGESMFLIVEGRVKISVDREGGMETVLNHLGPGAHFGELSMLVGGPRTATVTATMGTELLELTRADFHQLMAAIPGFAVNLSRTLGVWLRGEISGRRRYASTRILAVVRSSPGSDDLPLAIVAGLLSYADLVQVVSDRPHLWRGKPGCHVHPLPERSDDSDRQRVIRQALTAAEQPHGPILLDVDQRGVDARLLMQCELVWWPLGENFGNETELRLRELTCEHRRLSERIEPVLEVRIGSSLPVVRSLSLTGVRPVVRVGWWDAPQGARRYRPSDVARLVHCCQGIHLGLALGGGGARGLAHIGVIQACDEAGIYFDRLAGTSAGALIGSMVAAGYPLKSLVELVDRELTPPKWMRFLPRTKRCFMLALYRLRLAERRLRRYLHDYQFEQLLIPVHTVSVDLISGSARVREQGDVVDAILESINLPVIGVPILRHGDALVDGGVLVNVPATVLRERQANFVVAVDVGSKLAPHFAGNTRSTPSSELKPPGILETIIRVTEVQQRGLASIHASDSDLLIQPDTSAYPFDDFSRVDELIDIGRAAAHEALPDLKQRLHEFVGQPDPTRCRAA